MKKAQELDLLLLIIVKEFGCTGLFLFYRTVPLIIITITN